MKDNDRTTYRRDEVPIELLHVRAGPLVVSARGVRKTSYALVVETFVDALGVHEGRIVDQAVQPSVSDLRNLFRCFLRRTMP